MRTRLLTTTIVLTLLLALASLPAFAGNKVDVCHLPPGNPYNWHTISVSSNALGAHLGHGDLEGSCAANCETLCDDFDACTQDIESDFNQCVCSAEPRPAVNCDDSNPCTVDSCNSEFGCTYDTDATECDACDDGDPDTTGDVCTAGVCAGTPLQHIVQLNANYPAPDYADLVASGLGTVGAIWTNALNGFLLEGLDANELATLLADSRVERVEADSVFEAATTPWGLDRIDQRSLPLNDSYNPSTGGGAGGAGSTVWVLDTGIRDTHADFGGRAQQVVSFAAGGNQDCNGHGTHVAGIIGGSTYGVATAVQLQGVKVLDCCGTGTASSVISGIDHVIANAGSSSIAIMALAGGASIAVDTAADNMSSAGIPTVVAGGNDNADACNFSPARASQMVAVGATDIFDNRSSFSNTGNCLEIFAPGSSIPSTWYTSDSATETLSGTSAAAAHVAGALVLYGGSSSALLSNATPNTVVGPGIGSPNQFVYD